MKSVRIGIIGCGGMGSGHARVITDAKARDFCLAAVSDADAARAEAVGRQFGVPYFTDNQRLIQSGLVDAVIIATPHYYHPPLTIAAARAGLHVLTEKPVAVSVGPARAMVAECAKRRVALGVMFQQRNRPNMLKMKRLVAAGAVGEVFRVQMICSNWYRTQAYYDSGAWRGTWSGEGGGILLNQAPHSLDLFQWIGGMPKRVLATVCTRHHRIEVENTANAILDYGNGKTGYIYATTAEAPGYEQLMVCGDKGTLIAEGDALRLAKLAMPLKKHLLTWRKGFEQPACKWLDVPLPKTEGSHINITRAFVAHVLRGTPLVATGKEGVNELELSNAIYLSGFQNRAVELPLRAGQVERLLDGLVRARPASGPRKRPGKRQDNRKDADADLRRLLGRFPA